MHVTETEHQVERRLLEAVIGREGTPHPAGKCWGLAWDTAKDPWNSSLPALGVAFGRFERGPGDRVAFSDDGRRSEGWLIRDGDRISWPPKSFQSVLERLRTDKDLRKRHRLPKISEAAS